MLSVMFRSEEKLNPFCFSLCDYSDVRRFYKLNPLIIYPALHSVKAGGMPKTAMALLRSTLCLFLALSSAPSAVGQIFVDKSATGQNNGSSWQDAYTDLQSALDDTLVTSEEIWIAKGIYLPSKRLDPIDSRSVVFHISLDGVRLYGGFSGFETERMQRDIKANRTVLSADIDTNDIVDEYGVTQSHDDIVGSNAYGIIYLDGTSGSAHPITERTVLDGITLTGSSADNALSRGGVLRCDGSGSQGQCGPILTNLTVVGSGGVGRSPMEFIATDGGTLNPIFKSISISGNFGRTAGAALFRVEGSTADIVMTDITVKDNIGSSGGGIYFSLGGFGPLTPGKFSIRDSYFEGNTGVYGGAVTAATANVSGSIDVADSLFVQNKATVGGAIYSERSSISFPVRISSSRFEANESTQDGGAVYSSWGGNIITNSFFYQNRTQLNEACGGAYATKGGRAPNFNPPKQPSLIVNSIFVENESDRGGAVCTISLRSVQDESIIINSSFQSNLAQFGGAIFNDGFDEGLILQKISNSLLWGNSATEAGPTIFNRIAEPTITHSLLEGAGGSGSLWDPSVGIDGGGNLDTDPLLKIGGHSVPVPTGASPLVDAGSLLAASPYLPIACNTQVDFNALNRVAGLEIDIGAIEHQVVVFSDRFQVPCDELPHFPGKNKANHAQ